MERTDPTFADLVQRFEQLARQYAALEAEVDRLRAAIPTGWQPSNLVNSHDIGAVRVGTLAEVTRV